MLLTYKSSTATIFKEPIVVSFGVSRACYVLIFIWIYRSLTVCSFNGFLSCRIAVLGRSIFILVCPRNLFPLINILTITCL